jgi:hypothetical protein
MVLHRVHITPPNPTEGGFLNKKKELIWMEPTKSWCDLVDLADSREDRLRLSVRCILMESCVEALVVAVKDESMVEMEVLSGF